MEDIDYTDDIFDNLWIKKYAPKSISEMVLSEENRTKVEGYIRDNDIPSLLFAVNLVKVRLL